MSFARAIVVVVLAIQVLGILRELLFAIGIGGFINGLAGGDPTVMVGMVVLVGSALLLVPVARGSRWATLAAIPLLALLLLAIVPVFAEFWARPGEDFPIWITVTILLLSAALGIPFAIIATLEAFGRRAPSRLQAHAGFSRAALVVTGVVGSLAGMALLGAAVAVSPAEGSAAAALDGPPDETVTITMDDLRFTPAALTLTAGKRTAIFIVNEDGASHSVDVDELDLHATVGGNRTAVVMVTPERPGSYELYCAVGGHAEAGMVGTVVVEG